MRLKDQNIVIFSQMQFDNALESTIYTIAKLLAKNNQVYYVDRPYTWFDYFKFRKTKSFATRKPHFFDPDNSIAESGVKNLHIVITPPVPSINMLPEGWLYRTALQLNELIVSRRLKHLFKQKGIKDYIYINSYNFAYPSLHKKLAAPFTVYHCVDPIIEPYQTRHGLISEDLLVKSTDMVISTSKELRNTKAQLNSNSFFVPNAANIGHSQNALDPDLPAAGILAGIPRPVIGYFGAVERRIDYNFVKQLLKRNPDKSFVFVGPIDEYYINKKDYNAPNLFLTGPVPYAQMPAVLKGFDVAIIPFKNDKVSNHIFPLKLFEYLGAGKPVVSTNFNPDLREFTGDTVAWCSSPDEFSLALDKALDDTPALLEKRLIIAADNTWEHRIEEIEGLLALLKADKNNIIANQQAKKLEDTTVQGL